MGCGQEYWADIEERARRGDQEAIEKLKPSKGEEKTPDPWATPHWTYPSER